MYNRKLARRYRDLVTLLFADALDDVMCDLNTLRTRDRNICAHQRLLGPAISERADQFVQRGLAKATHYASGAPIHGPMLPFSNTQPFIDDLPF